ncbi:MAG: MbnP family protein [Chitinophagaceae bacterium]|jgi:hypothetical protein
MSVSKIYSALFCLIALSACRKKDLPTPANPGINNPAPTKGQINIKIRNTAGVSPLIVGNGTSYTLPNGEEFSVNSFNYYISNIVFTDEKGNKFTESESYHLAIATNPASLNFIIKNVPFGKYAKVDFLIGVDSTRNFSGAQTGDLDPKFGMFWTWSSGYVMARLEGKSPQSGSPEGDIAFHIGGYKDQYNVIQKVSLVLPQAAYVSENVSPVISLQADVEKWFKDAGLELFTFKKTFLIVTAGSEAFQMSQNYSDMFSVLTVENK